MLTAFVLISAEPKGLADLAPALAEVEGVAEAYSTAGEADIVAVVRVRRHEDLAEVVTTRIARLEGILRTRTLIAFRAYSQRDVAGLWDFD